MQFINKQLFNIYCFFLINEIMKKTQRNRLDDEREGDTLTVTYYIWGVRVRDRQRVETNKQTLTDKPI